MTHVYPKNPRFDILSRGGKHFLFFFELSLPDLCLGEPCTHKQPIYPGSVTFCQFWFGLVHILKHEMFHPIGLWELCIPVSTSAGRHFLRSATYGDLLVPRTSTSTYGPRSFAVSGPSIWNKLPATLRVSPTLGQFQSKLKAVLFRSAYETWLGAFVTA